MDHLYYWGFSIAIDRDRLCRIHLFFSTLFSVATSVEAISALRAIYRD